jgi:hypothetical protein
MLCFMCPTLLFGFNARMTKGCNCFQFFISTYAHFIFFYLQVRGRARLALALFWPSETYLVRRGNKGIGKCNCLALFFKIL